MKSRNILNSLEYQGTSRISLILLIQFLRFSIQKFESYTPAFVIWGLVITNHISIKTSRAQSSALCVINIYRDGNNELHPVIVVS